MNVHIQKILLLSMFMIPASMFCAEVVKSRKKRGSSLIQLTLGAAEGGSKKLLCLKRRPQESDLERIPELYLEEGAGFNSEEDVFKGKEYYKRKLYKRKLVESFEQKILALRKVFNEGSYSEEDGLIKEFKNLQLRPSVLALSKKFDVKRHSKNTATAFKIIARESI